MYPILFQIGPFHIASFGLMMATGFLVGRYILKKELIRKRLDAGLTDRIFTAALIGGIVGAKLFHLLESPSERLLYPLSLLVTGSFLQGLSLLFSGYGFAWYGGLMGGTVAVLWVLHRAGCLGWDVPDAMAPALTAGYFFGRAGCQLAGDGDYGPPTTLPWGMSYPHGVVPTLQKVHPTPVYEMLEMVIVFAILWRLRTRIRNPGVLFCIYLVLIGTARFAAEFVRLTPKVALGLTLHQWISIGLVLFGTVAALRLRRQPAPQKA